MKTLILFSLKRRFKNRVTITLSLMFLVIVSLIVYADKVSDALELDFNKPYEVVLSEDMKAWINNVDLWYQQGFQFTQETGNLLIDKVEDTFVVVGKTDIILQTKIRELILNNKQSSLLSKASPSAQEWIDEYNNVELQFDTESFGIDYLKQQFIIVLLTSLYFMMLNFIAVNSNEIILEKTSNVLALYLSCVSVLEHYLAKFFSGLLNVSIQILGSIVSIATILFVRYQYDEGYGLFKLVSKYLPLPLENLNLNSILMVLDLNLSDLITFSWSLIFLIVGISIVQVLVLVLSSRVRNSEEAGAIQGPFYLGLLILYYGSLSINSPEQLSTGIGYFLSFIPISSMLIMPMRIVSTSVSMFDILISTLISVSTLAVILGVFYPLYKKGLSRT